MSGVKLRDGLFAILALGLAFALLAYEPRENLDQSQSISDETITFSYAPEFGLAVTPEQILVRSYIPPCDEDFHYCLYLVSGEYQGTNFESAGLRIKERTDLGSPEVCLNTPPEGYTVFEPEIHTGQEYATSVFAPVGEREPVIMREALSIGSSTIVAVTNSRRASASPSSLTTRWAQSRSSQTKTGRKS